MINKGDKFKKIDIRFFLAPFLILFFMFAMISYIGATSHIKNTYERIEEYSLGLAESYTRRIANSNAAAEIITDLIDEKLLSAGEAVMQLGDEGDFADLSKLSEKYFVDEINIYNEFGKVINSTTENMLGFTTYAGHPPYQFMIGDQDVFAEAIRPNAQTGVAYKYAYIRRGKHSFIQIGVLADRISNFLYNFEIHKLIEDFMGGGNVENIYFTNMDYELVASGTKEYEGMHFGEEDIHAHFLLEEAMVGKEFIGEDGVLHVCAPVFYNDNKIGTLTVIWSQQIIDAELKQIVWDNLLRFFMVSILLGSVLYYAYRKNKANIEIAFYDKLTGLPNHDYLKEYLSQKIKGRAHKKMAVLLLNCANFSLINLTYGFEYGDGILKQTAKSVSGGLSSKDMLFRLDADKFVMVVNDYSETEQLEALSKRLLESFKKPDFDMHKHEYLHLRISIYELHDQSASAGQVIHNASLGMVALKNEANKDYIIYNREMKAALIRDELIEKALISIISGERKEDLYMVYQPLYDIKTNKIAGFEALARMSIQDVGQVSPVEFISLAERRNLIFSLGNIILKEVCEFVRLLKNSDYAGTYVSINISGLQLLRDEFIETMKRTAGIPHEDWEHIIFEITESVLVENSKLANEKLTELKNLGISVALDDFGTGYSSLAELRDLDIDLIKIDRNFIGKIGEYDEEILITQDVITMSHRLGLKVVAEGVENERQMNYLVSHGCDLIQGYYISKPLLKCDAMRFLKLHSAKGAPG